MPDAGESALPDAPPALDAIFGEHAPLARRFAEHLATSGVERGLLGPREVARVYDRHVLNCAVIESLIPVGATCADVGSGAGLPGIAVAIARPDLTVTLVEPLQRRVSWLESVVEDLELERVRIVRARAEELVGQLAVDVVTARAVAALPQLARWCLPLLLPGGTFLAVKGQSAATELASAEKDLRSLGARSWIVEVCGAELLDPPTTVVTVVRGAGKARTGRSRRTSAGR